MYRTPVRIWFHRFLLAEQLDPHKPQLTATLSFYAYIEERTALQSAQRKFSYEVARPRLLVFLKVTPAEFRESSSNKAGGKQEIMMSRLMCVSLDSVLFLAHTV